MRNKKLLLWILAGLIGVGALIACNETSKDVETVDDASAVSAVTTKTEETEAMPADERYFTHQPGENIVITAFWPPNPYKLDAEEQLRLMADMGITEVFGAGNGCDNRRAQTKLLEIAERYGMTMIVSDGTFGDTVLTLSKEQIMENVALYADNPTVVGFYLRDEPANPNIYIDAYRAIREAAPHLDGHLNFIHMTAVGNPIDYYRKIGDWASLTNAVNAEPTYLMYDYYPFLYSDAPFDYDRYFEQFEILHELGLKNDNPTAYYVQSAYTEDYPYNPANMRMPTAVENRFQIYSALAYGFKQLSYFTWITGIVTEQGTVNDCYSYMAEINHEALALGPILVKCDAVDVYMTQNAYRSTELLPENYIISIAENGNADMICTRFVHKETGRNYLMFVNNDMTSAQSLTFSVADDIMGLEVVSREDSSLSAYSGDHGTYTVSLEAGDGILLALPENYICPVDLERAAKSITDTNIALDARVMASSSTGTEQWGQTNWFVSNLTDGIYKPGQLINNDAPGWQSENDTAPTLTFDLREPISFDRLVLYPSGARHGEENRFGVYMPRDCVISVSADGETWTEAAVVKDYTHGGIKDSEPLTVTLDGTVGRYLRVEVTGAVNDENGNPLVQLGETEIYGSAAADKTVLSEMLGQYESNGGDTDDRVYQTAKAAEQDAGARQKYVDLLVQSLKYDADE